MCHPRPLIPVSPFVATLERHLFASAPALSENLHPSGWLLRNSGGYTKRGNSASPICPTVPLTGPTLCDILAKLLKPAIIRITPLAHPGDDGFLDELGWRILDPSIVMVRTLDRSLSSFTMRNITVSTSPHPTPGWVNGFATSSSLSPSQTAVFQTALQLVRSPSSPAYLTMSDSSNTTDVAYGQAVRSGDIVGLFNIVVPEACRGVGHGRRMTQALLDWGLAQGASMAYLQVTEKNEAAKELYMSMGFREEYRYHYRVAP